MIAYAITDPSTLDFNRLKEDLERLSSMACMIVYRDKYSNAYEQNATLFLEHAKGFEKVLLHDDYKLAVKLQADGVHFPSTSLNCIEDAKELGLFVVVSTHTIEEAKIAQNRGADMITFSPIFETPNKGKAVGLYVLESMVSSVCIPVIALGGILTQEQIESCAKVGAKGFASIRYFERKVLSAL